MSTAQLQKQMQEAAAAVNALANALGSLPAINSVEIRAALEDVAFYKRELLDHNFCPNGQFIHEVKPVPPELLEEVGDDYGRRAAILAWLLECASSEIEDKEVQGYMDEASGYTLNDVFQLRRDEIVATCLRPIRRVLDQVPVERIPPDAILWEMHAAGLAQYASRVVAICTRAATANSDPGTLSIVVRAAFLASRAEAAPDVPSEWVVPAWWMFDQVETVGNLFRMKPAILVAQCLPHRLQAGTEPASLSANQQTVSKISFWIELLQQARDLDDQEVSIRAWVQHERSLHGMSGDIRSAAVHFEGEATRLGEEGEATFLAAAATCYLAAGEPEAAEKALRRRSECARDRAQAALELAQCYHLQDKEDEVLDAFERYVRLKGRPAGLEEFSNSLVIKFGLLARARADVQSLIASAAMMSPRRAHGEAILAWCMPFYPLLSDDARGRWWVAFHTLSSPESVRMVGAQRWRVVAENIAEAVNTELRRRVLIPFLKDAADQVRSQRLQSQSREQRRVLEGRGGLGQNLALLKQSTYSQESLDRLLAQRLRSRHPSLWHYLDSATNRRRTDRLVVLRNRAAHDEASDETLISEAEARETFELARELMATFVKPE